MTPALVRTLDDLRGPAGRLESLYAPARDGGAGAGLAAIVCHPHPLFGGTMHNKVVYHAAKVWQQAGMPVLRFNFRGAGASEGTHDRGEGEQDDLRAAMDWMERETGLPLLVTGFSFGAWVALRTCCGSESGRVRGLVALGLPIAAGDRAYSYEFLSGCELPKLFVSGAADAFGPVDAVADALRGAAAPSEIVFLPDGDHFFQKAAGGHRLNEMQAVLRQWLGATFGSRAGSAGPETGAADAKTMEGGCR